MRQYPALTQQHPGEPLAQTTDALQVERSRRNPVGISFVAARIVPLDGFGRRLLGRINVRQGAFPRVQ